MNIWKCWHHTYRVVIYNEKSVLNITEIYNKLNWGCFQSAAWIKSMVTNCETSWDERVFSVYVIVYIGEYGGGLSCSYTWRPECTLIHGECTLCGNGTPDISALGLQNLICTDVQTHTERLLPPVCLPSVEFKVKSVTGRLQLQEKHTFNTREVEGKRDRRRRTGSEGWAVVRDSESSSDLTCIRPVTVSESLSALQLKL